MMKWKMGWWVWLLFLGLLSGLFLVSCQPGETATPAPVEPSPVITEAPAPTETLASAYPPPLPLQTEAVAYPPPVAGWTPGPTVDFAYPEPGVDAGAPVATVENPQIQNAYPGMATGAADQPYPAPGSTEVSAPPTVSGSPALVTQTPNFTPSLPPTTPNIVQTVTPTSAPTPTATPQPLDVKLIETDPGTVELESGRPQMILLYAYWDGASQMMAPVMLSLEEMYGSQVNFIYLDIDNPETQQLKRALGYKQQPHLFLVDQAGKILHQWMGLVEQPELDAAIRSALQ